MTKSKQKELSNDLVMALLPLLRVIPAADRPIALQDTAERIGRHLPAVNWPEMAFTALEYHLPGLEPPVFKVYETAPALDDEVLGKLLILAPSRLAPAHRNFRNQLWEARGGFGCSGSKIGTKIYATSLWDGEHEEFRRADFLGMASHERASELRELRIIEKPDQYIESGHSQRLVAWKEFICLKS